LRKGSQSLKTVFPNSVTLQTEKIIPMNNILVPVGSSNNAVSNLQYAIDLAKEIDGKVYMVSVFKEMSNVGEHGQGQQNHPGRF
jgi:hypothetical protein